jgi:hypothetical protein
MKAYRQYEPWECGQDGYPFAWHGRCLCDGAALETNDCVYDICTGGASAIKDMIRAEAQDRCERCRHPYSKGEGEWSACDERCTHGGPMRGRPRGTDSWFDEFGVVGTHPAEIWEVQARYRILTVHHLDEDKANCRWWNLVALCQRCHLRMQHGVVMGTPYHYEHSTWFKPYAAAFYAFKYLGEDLDRATVMERQDELLKLEHQGTQESLL